MNRTTIARRCFSILAVAILAQPAIAYPYPLSSTAIRNAYFLGAGDPVKLGNFLEQYAKYYPTPKSGQYVHSIRFKTPYYLVAERISQPLSRYHAPDAEEEFLGKPAFCQVQIEIFYGLSTNPANYQSDYAVRLKQSGKEIPIQRKWREFIGSFSHHGTDDEGMYLRAEYRAEDIDPESPATVEVIAPDGRNVIETFDLGSLK